ncbi:helix-turn-helix domain-containing protein [Stenotrophomonas maltophilia]|nr:helix-turn-helix domain-containing protein [Stenotrophomonas maltophilia]
MKATDLIESLTRRLGTTSQGELAAALGVSVGTLINWKNRDEDLSANQVASALAKSREAAVDESQLRAIQPIVEFYTIDRCLTKQEKSWQVFNGGSGASKYAQGVKAELEGSYGICIFYDSRGQALYVGKAREQSLWREINLAFNRRRDVQSISLVSHPDRNREFKPGYEKLRQPKRVSLELFDLAGYFSAYDVDAGMIDDLEALMVRGFANDLLNIRMETFAHLRK